MTVPAPEPSCTDLIGPTLEGVLACAKAALDDCGRPVGRAHLAPGAQVAWDDCCPGGGQLWVRVISIFPTGGQGVQFPSMDTAQRCGVSALGATLGVGVMRCAHTVDDNGQAPTQEQLTGDTLGITADASILLRAIMCCVPTIPALKNLPLPKVGRWLPQGPSGGCAGGEWELTVALGTCSC